MLADASHRLHNQDSVLSIQGVGKIADDKRPVVWNKFLLFFFFLMYNQPGYAARAQAEYKQDNLIHSNLIMMLTVGQAGSHLRWSVG